MLILAQHSNEFAIQILWATLFILFALTLLLLLTSLYMRWLHKRAEDKLSFYKDKFYPIILEYVESGEDLEEMLAVFGGRNIEYSAFEKVIVDLLEYVQGNDAEKLRKLLYIDPIFNYHEERLESKSDVIQVRSCIYFSKIKLSDDGLIEKLQELLVHKNRFVGFSAASALMAATDVSVRAHALQVMAQISQVSEMALLELLYRFKYKHDDQREEEVEHLMRIIDSDSILSDNRALLILGVSEMSYFQLGAFFYERLLSDKQKWNIPMVKTALVYAQEYFLNMEASPHIRELVRQDDLEVKKAAIEVLSKFRSVENESEIFAQVGGKDEEFDFFVIKILMEEGYDSDEIKQHITSSVDSKYLDRIIEMVKPELEYAV